MSDSFRCDACGAPLHGAETSFTFTVCVSLSTFAKSKFCASCALPVVKLFPHFERQAELVRALEYGQSQNVAQDIERAFDICERGPLCKHCNKEIAPRAPGVNAAGEVSYNHNRLFCTFNCRDQYRQKLIGPLRPDPGPALQAPKKWEW